MRTRMMILIRWVCRPVFADDEKAVIIIITVSSVRTCSSVVFVRRLSPRVTTSGVIVNEATPHPPCKYGAFVEF